MKGQIKIFGQIGTVGETKGIELIDVIQQVKRQPNAESFEVFINSDGGVVETGFDIYNYLKSLGVPITTIGTGMVASIATVIFMAGSRREVKPGTKFMIHLPMGGMQFATADEMDKFTKEVRTIENHIINFYAKELGLNKEAIAPLLRNQTWLNNDQLSDLGFLTTGGIQMVARVNKKNDKMKTNKFKAFLNMLKGEVVNKVLYTADSKELNFPEIGEDGAIEVGAKATLDGQPAEGEIAVQSGEVYVFEGGVLTEIKEVMEEEEMMTNEALVEILEPVLELASELEERVQTVEGEITGLKTERDEFKKKFEDAQKVIAKLKGSSQSADDDKKEKKKDDGKEVSKVVALWKERRTKKNK